MAASAERYVSRLTRETLALVLAGGRGERLGELTRWRAKPAVPFAGKFRIIDFTLSNCVNSGVRRVGVLTQYKSHSLIRHLHHGWGFLHSELGEFVEILPASQRLDEEWYTGTADAVYQNLDILRQHEPSYVLILAGDHVYKMDYGPMLAFHSEHGAGLTIGCVEVPIEEAGAFGVMRVDEELRVREFLEKPEHPKPMPGREDAALASMGIYVFDTELLYRHLIRDADDPRSGHDFGRDVIPAAIEAGTVYAYPFRGTGAGRPAYWRDVGTVDAYYRANIETLQPDAALDLHDRQWPIWTYQEQLPPAQLHTAAGGKRAEVHDSMLSGGCVITGARVEGSVLFSSVRVAPHAVLRDSVVLPEVRIGEGCRIRRTVLDKRCALAPGTVIGEDPAADARRFHVSAGGVVLVTPDMLGQDVHRIR